MVSAASIERSVDRGGDVRPPGSVVAGCYRIEELLGTGGMATVYRAVELASGRRVALKLLRRELSTNPEAATRFRREGEVLQSFTHPGIVRVDTFGALDDGTLFLAMELLEGETLGQMMRRRGPLDPLEVGPILTGACAPLASAHAKGIVHRDLKPDNVFLVRAPGAPESEFQVKLLDFGISKVFGSERLTQTGELLGTPRYMAPEQLAADDDLDGRVDVYALGVIVYEMLAACPPFLGSTPSDLIVAILHGKIAPLRTVRADLPPEIESVVMRTMARAREARYATPEELANAFVSALGRPSTPGPMRAPPRARAGMATAVLGSMQSERPPPTPAPAGGRGAPPTLVNAPALPGPPRAVSASASEPLVPGTMSGFASNVAPAPAPVPQPVAPRAPAFAAPTAVPVPERAPMRAPQPGVGAGPMERRDARHSEPRYSEPPVLPMRGGGRTGLIIVALLAGAISMGVVILALTLLGRGRAARGPRPASPPPATLVPSGPAVPAAAPGAMQPVAPLPNPAQPSPDSQAAQVVVPPAIAQLVVPPAIAPVVVPPAIAAQLVVPPAIAPQVVPLPDAVVAADDSLPEAQLRRRRVPSNSAPDTPPPPAVADPAAPPTASELMMEARRALARGEPEVCTALVERALTSGAPAIALKLQGDCYRRSSRDADALRSYQRFCRLAPDNPAISEVRALAEVLGGACP